MTYEKYYEILAANQDDELTLDEMIGVVAEMYHATPDQVQEVPEIVDALEVYQDDQDLKELIESLMHETSEKFIPCGNCEEVYPAEDLVDAGTGKWTDDLCPDCLDRLYDEVKGFPEYHRLISELLEEYHLTENRNEQCVHRAVIDALNLEDDGFGFVDDETVAEMIRRYYERSEEIYEEHADEFANQEAFDWLDVSSDFDTWFAAEMVLYVRDNPDLVQEPKGQISLAAARVNAGLTQKEAGELIGVTQLTIRNWELGKYKPTPERYPAIEEAYKMPIESIKI